MFEIEEEESLDLVAVDAEVIKGMIRTQGEIIGLLQNINMALLGLSKIIGIMANETGNLCNINADLAESLKNYTLVTMEEKEKDA